MDCITEESEMVAQERAALAVWLLMQAPRTTGEIALRVGLSHAGAHAMLQKIARRVPIFFADGIWEIYESPVSNQ
jgi:DNA-binding transcriptional regulator LsrR (DeoR family)